MGMYGLNSLNEVFRGKVSVIPKIEEPENISDNTNKVLGNIMNGGLKQKTTDMHNKLFGNNSADVMNKITGKGFGNNNIMTKISGSNIGTVDINKKLGNFGVKNNDKFKSLIRGNNSMKFSNTGVEKQLFSTNNKLQSLIGGHNINSGVSKENQVWASLKPNLNIQGDSYSQNGIFKNIKDKVVGFVERKSTGTETSEEANLGPTIVDQDIQTVGQAVGKGAKYVGGKVVEGAKYVGGIVAGSIPTKQEVIDRIKENREINRQVKLAKQGIGQKYSVRESEDKAGNITRSYIPLEGVAITPAAQKAIELRRTKDIEFQDALRRKEAGINTGISSGTDPGLLKELLRQGGKKKGGLTETQVNQILAMNRGGGSSQPQGNKFMAALSSGLPGSAQGIALATQGAVMMPGNPQAMQGAIGNVGGSWGQIAQATQSSSGGSSWDNIKRATETPINPQGMSGTDKIRWMTASSSQKEAILKEIQERQLQQPQIQQQPIQQPQIQQQPVQQPQGTEYSPYSKKPVTYIRGPYRQNR